MLLCCVLLFLQVHCTDEVSSRFSTLMCPARTNAHRKGHTERQQLKETNNSMHRCPTAAYMCMQVCNNTDGCFVWLTGNFVLSFSRTWMITVISSSCFLSCCSSTCKQVRLHSVTHSTVNHLSTDKQLILKLQDHANLKISSKTPTGSSNLFIYFLVGFLLSGCCLHFDNSRRDFIVSLREAILSLCISWLSS